MHYIDIHAHFHPVELMSPLDGVKAHPEGSKSYLDMGYPVGPITEGMWDLSQRFMEMDAMGITQQVFSGVPSTFRYTWEPKKAQSYVRRYNTQIAELQQHNPQKIIGVGLLPLQSPELTLTEIDYGLDELGLAGFEIGTSVGTQQLDDAGLDPVFAKLAQRQTPILLHPHIGGPLSYPYDRYELKVSLYFPLQTTLAAIALVFGGIMERYPGLAIILAHGGGFYPYQKGRFDHTYRVRNSRFTDLSREPSYYFKKFFYDTVTHDLAALAFLLDFVGPDQLLFGSDAPFDMAPESPASLIEDLPITDSQKSQILTKNAQRLFHV